MVYTNPTPQRPNRERNSPDAPAYQKTTPVEPGAVGPSIHPVLPVANVGDPTPINSMDAPAAPTSSVGSIPAPTVPQVLPLSPRPAPKIV